MLKQGRNMFIGRGYEGHPFHIGYKCVSLSDSLSSLKKIAESQHFD